MAVLPAAAAGGSTAVPEVRDVLLVGGGTRMPKLQQLLLVNGRRPRIAIAPEQAAALGAAVQVCARQQAPQSAAHAHAMVARC